MKTGILATGMAFMGAFALALPAQAEKIEGNGKVIFHIQNYCDIRVPIFDK